MFLLSRIEAEGGRQSGMSNGLKHDVREKAPCPLANTFATTFSFIDHRARHANKAGENRQRFTAPPMCKRDLLTFAAESQFVASETSDSADRLADSIFASHKAKRIPVWNATMHADQRDLAFGDSEEMRFGARVTTPNMEEKAVASGIRWDCKLQKQAAAK